MPWTRKDTTYFTWAVLIAALLWVLLGACASAPPKNCITLLDQCGNEITCCNDDGKLCPVWCELEEVPGTAVGTPTVSFDAGADTGCYWAGGAWHLVVGGQGFEDSYGICLVLE